MAELKIVSTLETPSAQSNERGKLFEKLMRDILRSYGYEIQDISVNYSGMEIDIEGVHTISGTPLYAECKFYEKAVDSPKVQAFYGKYMSRWRKNNKAIGLFIAIPGLNSHASAFYKEVSEDSGITLKLLEKHHVLESIYNSNLTVKPEYIASQITHEVGQAGDQILLYSEKGLFWIQYVIPIGSVIPTRIAIFDAKGHNITRKEDTDLLKKLYPELNEFDIIGLHRFISKQLLTPPSDLEPIVEVKGGVECFEYQFPSSPKFFIGRKDILSQIDKFVDKVINKMTTSRGILFTANSGWGKSSTVLACVERLAIQGHFAIAIDSRAASSSQFILKVIEHTFSKTGNFNGIISTEDTKTVSGFEGAVEVLIRIGQLLEAHNKVLVIFLDQFENLFLQADALRRIKEIFLKVCDAQTNIIFGYSWKIDIIGQVNSFPYQLREEITSASYSIPLAIFSDIETDALLDELQREMKSKLRQDLRFFISDFSQGFPWLLKKLCAHVKSQYESGVLQASLANSLLNVEEIFQSDLRDLQPEEEDTLRRIAKLVPINAMDLGEEFNTILVQTLVNRRLLIRVGIKYDIYWDIFRDYLNTGRLPVQENYVLRVAVTTILKEFRKIHNALEKEKRLTPDEYQENYSAVSQTTFNNVFHELKLLGLVNINPENNCLNLIIPFTDNNQSFEKSLQVYLSDRLQRNRLISRLMEILDKEGYLHIHKAAKLLSVWCPYISASNKTWAAYAKTFAKWMKATGLATFDNKNLLLHRKEADSALSEYSLLDVELGTRNHTGMPSIQYGAVKDVLFRIVAAMKSNGRVDSVGVSKSTWLKALSNLESLGFIVKQPRNIGVLPIAVEFVDEESKRRRIFAEQAMRMYSFAQFVSILQHHSEVALSLLELGKLLAYNLGADWADGTAEGNAKIMMNWARYANLTPAAYNKPKRKPININQKRLFDDI